MGTEQCTSEHYGENENNIRSIIAQYMLRPISLFPITNLLSPIKTITDTFYSTEPVHKNYIQVFVSYQNEHYSSNNKLMANTIKGIFYQITTCTFDHTRTPTLQISFFYSVFKNTNFLSKLESEEDCLYLWNW